MGYLSWFSLLILYCSFSQFGCWCSGETQKSWRFQIIIWITWRNKLDSRLEVNLDHSCGCCVKGRRLFFRHITNDLDILSCRIFNRKWGSNQLKPTFFFSSKLIWSNLSSQERTPKWKVMYGITLDKERIITGKETNCNRYILLPRSHECSLKLISGVPGHYVL